MPGKRRKRQTGALKPNLGAVSLDDPLAPYWHIIAAILVGKIGGRAEIPIAEFNSWKRRLGYRLEVRERATGDVKVDAQSHGVVVLEMVNEH